MSVFRAVLAVAAVAGTLTAAPASAAAAASPWSAAEWTSSNGNNVTDVAKTIGATGPAATGLDGTGVGIALIDTGFASVPGLPAAHVVNGPDLSFESQASNLRYLDTYGHGTHLAGIMIGNDPSSGLRGIAPGAKLTSVKVAASNGAVDVTQVMAALNWVVAHRNDDPANPIRVINLAYGTDANTWGTNDPLLFAVENAWNAGIVVVASAGNTGTTLGHLDNPGLDSALLTVGSAATQGTVSQADDVPSTFSSTGNANRSADLLAPGESIVSLRDPGSYLDQNYPAAEVGTSLFRGSGTSQAAAVVSGAVALLLQKQPKATPNQIRFWLRDTATKLKSGPLEVNVDAALKTPMPSLAVATPQSTGTGSLEASRGSIHVVHNSAQLSGASDIFGSFSTSAWAAAVNKGTAWQGGVWMGHRMAGDGWSGTSWASKTWAASAWSGRDWGKQDWGDSSWSGHSWSGHYWSATQWDGHYWSASAWDATTWASAGWG